MRAIGKKEARRMFGRLKERFGRKKQPTVSYNQREAHEGASSVFCAYTTWQ